MTRTVKPQAYRARLVFPVAAPPLRDGVVTLAGERIVAVGENLAGSPPIDLGDVALLPGLVNAHTHLEFSLLPAPLGQRGMRLADWITTLVRHRRAPQGAASATDWRVRRAALTAGLQECLTYGVTTVGDVVTNDLEDVTELRLPIRWYAFRELLGQAAEVVDSQLAQARRHLRQLAGIDGVHAALSPHAPYSTSCDLIAAGCRLAAEHAVPVALHLAESPEELQWLADGTGPMRQMLEALHAWHPAAWSAGRTPRDYLELLAAAPHSLVVHGNYLGAADWDFLAHSAARMAVVYCPRTHDYFAHAPYPLAAMLRRGVRVVVGTDSRASSPDVNLWEDLRRVTQLHAQVALQDVLRMGTLGAAEALGCGAEVGSLARGKRADCALVRIAHQVPADPYQALWENGTVVQATMCAGRFVDQRRQQ